MVRGCAALLLYLDCVRATYAKEPNNRINKRSTSSGVTSIVEDPRFPSGEVSGLSAPRAVQQLHSSRSCGEGRIFAVTRASAYRPSQSTSGLEFAKYMDRRSSFRAKGKNLRILPAGPHRGHTYNERRVVDETCGPTAAKSKKQRRPQPVIPQKNAKGILLESEQAKRSLPLTACKGQGCQLEKDLLRAESNSIQKQALSKVFPQCCRQTTAQSYADTTVATQIIEHSWMFPRDEYRPPLSPHIPFSLDEDEDGTASALLVSMTEELRPSKAGLPKEDEYAEEGKQTMYHVQRSPSRKQESFQQKRPDVPLCVRTQGSLDHCQKGMRTPRNSSYGSGARKCEQSNNIEEAGSVYGEARYCCPQPEMLVTNVEQSKGLANVPPALPQVEGRPWTPPTDWCTTLSTAWITSSATASENPIRDASPGCARKDHKLKTVEDAVLAAKESNPTTNAAERWKLSPPSPAGVCSIPVAAPEQVSSMGGAISPAFFQNGSVPASDKSKSARVSCLQQYTAHLNQAGASDYDAVKIGPDKCASERAYEGNDTGRGAQQDLLQPQVRGGSSGDGGVKALSDVCRHRNTALVAVGERAESGPSPAQVRFRTEGTRHDFSATVSQQQIASQVLYPYTYKPWRTHYPATELGVLSRARVFARKARVAVSSVSGIHSGRPSPTPVQKQELMLWQIARVAVDPCDTLAQGRSPAGAIVYEEDESTTSHECSSDYTSEDSTRCSPEVQRMRNFQSDFRSAQRSLIGATSGGSFLAQSNTSPLLERIHTRGRGASSFLNKVHLRLQGRKLVGWEQAENAGAQSSLQQTFWGYCAIPSAFEEVAKDLAVARMLAALHQMKSASRNEVAGKCGHVFDHGTGCEKSKEAGNKIQPLLRGCRGWRFWDWPFKKRRRASGSQCEEA